MIDSGAAISLMHRSVYNMIEGCYKSPILPTAANLQTADGSPMSSMGKATLHLWIVDFYILHTFVIYNRLPKQIFVLVLT